MIFNNSDDVYNYLSSFLNFERKLDPIEYRLDRMLALNKLTQEADKSFPIIHVAGSKGKGSTSTMLASIYSEHYKTVGLFTSPHLLSFKERIAINCKPVSETEICNAANIIFSLLENKTPEDFPGQDSPTFFELLTIMSFLVFKNVKADIAIYEVGLGGRLDTTNIISPKYCVITSIELEHTEILGDTIPQIAYEKAGIIKKGIPVFTAVSSKDALDVIIEKAKSESAPFFVLDDEVDIIIRKPTIDGTDIELLPKSTSQILKQKMAIHTPMIGKIQARNVALATIVALYDGLQIEEIKNGIKKAFLPARFEILKTDPTIIIDGAHTSASSLACAQDFNNIFPDGGILLFGCAKGKACKAMAQNLFTLFKEVIITKPGTFKESDTKEMEKVFTETGFCVTRIDETEKAIQKAIEKAKIQKKALLVTGSFYLCAEVAKLYK